MSGIFLDQLSKYILKTVHAPYFIRLFLAIACLRDERGMSGFLRYRCIVEYLHATNVNTDGQILKVNNTGTLLHI
jgi:hypothetical protein